MFLIKIFLCKTLRLKTVIGRGMNSLNVGMKAEAVVLLESAVEMAEKGFPENDQDLLQFYGQLAHTVFLLLQYYFVRF